MGQEPPGSRNGGNARRVERRRTHERFEIVGLRSASVLAIESLSVLNVSASGALVDGALPLPPNAEYHMQFVLGSHVSEVVVRVRRVHSVPGDGGTVRYRTGLEFLTLAPEAADVINQFVDGPDRAER